MRWLALLALAGCTSPLTLGEETAEIIGGTRSTGVTSTVLLVSYPPDRAYLVTCTAVLISPTVLLTAAHCVDEENHPSHIYGVFTADDASPYPTLAAIEPHLLPVASVHPHPQYSTQAPFFADIATVVLASPTTIAPSPIQRTPLDASFVGREAKIVGYGQTIYGEYNDTRHEALTVVGELDRDTVVVGDAQRRPCLGDSGGPAFVDGTLIGVDSYAASGCTGPAHYRRTDWHVEFIDQYAPPAEPMQPDPMPEPMPTDQDGGGCATTSPSLLAGLAALLVRRRRRAEAA